MVELRDAAMRSNCRIKAWKLTEEQVMQYANEQTHKWHHNPQDIAIHIRVFGGFAYNIPIHIIP